MGYHLLDTKKFGNTISFFPFPNSMLKKMLETPPPRCFCSRQSYSTQKLIKSLLLCGLDGLAGALATLAGSQVLLNGLRALLDDLLAFGEDHLDVARVGHVRVDLGGVSVLLF